MIDICSLDLTELSAFVKFIFCIKCLKILQSACYNSLNKILSTTSRLTVQIDLNYLVAASSILRF